MKLNFPLHSFLIEQLIPLSLVVEPIKITEGDKHTIREGTDQNINMSADIRRVAPNGRQPSGAVTGR